MTGRERKVLNNMSSRKIKEIMEEVAFLIASSRTRDNFKRGQDLK